MSVAVFGRADMSGAPSKEPRGAKGSFAFEGGSLFLAAFALYGFGNNIASSTLTLSYPESVSAFYLGVQLFAIGMLLVCAVFERFRPLQLLLAFVLVFVMYASVRSSGDYSMIWLLAFVFCSDGVSLRKLAKASLIVNLVSVLLLASLSLAGIIENLHFGRGEAIRYCMGFLQPNNLGLRLSIIAVSVFVLRFGSFKLRDYIALAAVFLVCWQVCNSRTAMMAILILLAFMMLSKRIRSRSTQRALWVVAACVFAVCFLGSIYFMFFFTSSNPLHAAIDQLLSGRLYAMRFYAQEYPPALLGQNMEGVLTQTSAYTFYGFVLDNSWAHVIESSGLLISLALFVCLALLLWRAAKLEKPNPLPYLFIFYAVYGFSEASALNPLFAWYLIALSAFVFKGGLERFAYAADPSSSGKGSACPSQVAEAFESRSCRSGGV